ncbi:DUF4826 family protein [Natronospira bacteriovora]|uniref:DUF4826 family protein n=1 Tax=Natronospira bacteriovora TaxID=3069753 RepID=A0ABU0W8P4_9GAMM|nr:DUF4826 family protein [Natronospira sp. AB-CW4]MDQ2070398.1 DUF4826 family protein [Natronospira sp. AB-CW4]
MREEQEKLDNPEAIKAWGEKVAQDLARRLVQKGIFKGHARVEARWAMPGQILLGVAWQEDTPQRKVWVIGGEDVTPDVVELKAAKDPREAAKHFSMRWQLNGARIGSAAEQGGQKGQIDYKSIEEQFQKQAEKLYELAKRDELWQGIRKEPPTAE